MFGLNQKSNGEFFVSTWLWSISECDIVDIIQRLQHLNISRVFLWAEASCLENNAMKYYEFLKQAKAIGIDVKALIGDPSYSLHRNLLVLMRQVKAILAFNQCFEFEFSGIHLDIEPHCLDIWKVGKENEQCILREFTDNINIVSRFLTENVSEDKTKLSLSIDIPTWFENYKSGVDKIGLLEVLRLAVDEFSLMNYVLDCDMFVQRGNSILERMWEEGIPELSKRNTKISVGAHFESGNEDASLFSISEESLTQYFDKAASVFKNNRRFVGFSFHHYDSIIDYFAEKNGGLMPHNSERKICPLCETKMDIDKEVCSFCSWDFSNDLSTMNSVIAISESDLKRFNTRWTVAKDIFIGRKTLMNNLVRMSINSLEKKDMIDNVFEQLRINEATSEEKYGLKVLIKSIDRIEDTIELELEYEIDNIHRDGKKVWLGADIVQKDEYHFNVGQDSEVFLFGNERYTRKLSVSGLAGGKAKLNAGIWVGKKSDTRRSLLISHVWKEEILIPGIDE